MCPRPDWAKDDPERWQAYQDRRGGRMMIMGERMGALMAERGITQSEAWNITEDEIMSGELNLEEGLVEATERWVAAKQERLSDVA